MNESVDPRVSHILREGGFLDNDIMKIIGWHKLDEFLLQATSPKSYPK